MIETEEWLSIRLLVPGPLLPARSYGKQGIATLVLKVSLVLCKALFLASKFSFCCWISLLFIRKSFLSVSTFLPLWAKSSFCVFKAFSCSLKSSRSRFTSSSSFNLPCLKNVHIWIPFQSFPSVFPCLFIFSENTGPTHCQLKLHFCWRYCTTDLGENLDWEYLLSKMNQLKAFVTHYGKNLRQEMHLMWQRWQSLLIFRWNKTLLPGLQPMLNCLF